MKRHPRRRTARGGGILLPPARPPWSSRPGATDGKHAGTSPWGTGLFRHPAAERIHLDTYRTLRRRADAPKKGANGRKTKAA
jgi:hypothetical protein